MNVLANGKAIPAPGGPKCPNHGATLEGIGRPIPAKGTGQCPISGAMFEFEVETDASQYQHQLTLDGDVQVVAPYKVTGDETP